MATDKSEPRIGLIVRVAVLSVATLVVIRTGLVAYFDHIAQAEEYRKVGEAPPDALRSLRAAEEQRLHEGPMPIDSAMRDLAKRGRMAASPELVPSASRDVAPLQGWARMPSTVPVSMTVEPEQATPPAQDAGTTAATDGGPTKPAGAGGGKKKP